MNLLFVVIVIVALVATTNVEGWRIPMHSLRRAVAVPLICSALSFTPGLVTADERGIGNDSNVISDEEVRQLSGHLFVLFYFFHILIAAVELQPMICPV